MFTQGTARILIQRFDIICHDIARQNAKPFGQTERKAARKPGEGFIAAHGKQGFEQRCNLAVDKVLKAAADLVGHIGASLFIHKRLDRWPCDFAALDQFAYGHGAPHQATLFGKIQLGIGRVIETVGPQVEFRAQGLFGSLPQGARLIRAAAGILPETEPFKTADEFAFNRHFTFVIHLGHEGLLLFQPPHQNGCAAVNESLSQRGMQRIG